MGFSVRAPGGGTRRGPQPSVPAVLLPSPLDDAVSRVLHAGGVPVDGSGQLAWLGYPLPRVRAADLGRLHIYPQGGKGVGEPAGALGHQSRPPAPVLSQPRDAARSPGTPEPALKPAPSVPILDQCAQHQPLLRGSQHLGEQRGQGSQSREVQELAVPGSDLGGDTCRYPRDGRVTCSTEVGEG